jgi:hypothetical protein
MLRQGRRHEVPVLRLHEKRDGDFQGGDSCALEQPQDFGGEEETMEPVKFSDPVKWRDDKPFSFWPTLVSLVFGLCLIAAGIYFLRYHPELDNSPAQIGTVR